MLYVSEEQKVDSPKGKGRIRSWYAKYRGFIRVWVWVFVTTGFMLFILEEASQVRGFGRYSLLQGRMWTAAEQAAKEDKVFNNLNHTIARVSMFINPIAGYTFTRYFDSESVKLEREMQRIDKELGRLDSRVTFIEKKLDIKPIAEETIQQSEIQPVKQIDQQVKEEKPMFVATLFGKKYHRPSCRFVRNKEVREVTDPEADGLEPCQVCRPQFQKEK